MICHSLYKSVYFCQQTRTSLPGVHHAWILSVTFIGDSGSTVLKNVLVNIYQVAHQYVITV